MLARARPDLAWTSALALLLIPAAVMSVSTSGLAAYHYLLLLIPVILLAVGVALAAIGLLAGQLAFRRAWFFEGGAFAAALLIILPAARQEQRNAFDLRWNEPWLQARLLSAAHNLAWLRPRESDRLVCWGWSPQCYLDAAIRPATRDVTNEYQLYDTALRPYFRRRFLDDFARSRPDFVIDLTAPGDFGRFIPGFARGIAAFPEFAELVSADFDLVSRAQPPERCPRLYVRRARHAELDRSLIRFARITATAAVPGHEAAALDDGSVFATCDDDWLVPDKTRGAATMQFARPEPVHSVALLNTRAGADRVRLSLELAGKPVAATELTLIAFPRWTWHRLVQPLVADALTVEILSSGAARAGLNEVKAYRD